MLKSLATIDGQQDRAPPEICNSRRYDGIFLLQDSDQKTQLLKRSFTI
jgi:hypothetical protein